MMEESVRVYPLIFVFTAAGALLMGCDGLRGPKGGPDEFSIITRAPLSIPPDYGLRPPRPGMARPNETSPRDDARSNLLRNLGNRRGGNNPKNRPNSEFTSGEAALLRHADALKVDPEIRYIIERESGRIKEDETLVDTLVFWRKESNPKSLVDPAKEAERLRGNAALGKPPTEGKTPIIKKK